MFTVEVLEPLGTIVNRDGDAEIEKSGTRGARVRLIVMVVPATAVAGFEAFEYPDFAAVTVYVPGAIVI